MQLRFKNSHLLKIPVNSHTHQGGLRISGKAANDYHSVRVVILGSAASYGHVLFRNCAALLEKEGDWIAHRQKSKAYREAEKVVTMLVTIATFFFPICWLLLKKLQAYGVIRQELKWFHSY